MLSLSTTNITPGESKSLSLTHPVPANLQPNIRYALTNGGMCFLTRARSISCLGILLSEKLGSLAFMSSSFLSSNRV